MGIQNLYRYDLKEKRYTKRKLIGLALYWIVYLVFFVIVLHISVLFKILATIIATIGISPVLYQLRNSIYLKPGEKYNAPKGIPPQEFLDKVKKEVRHDKK